MKIKLLPCLKAFSCLALFLMLYPFVALINGFHPASYSNADCIFQQFIVIICGTLGCLFGFAVQNIRSKYPVRINLLFGVSCIIPTGAVALLLSGRDITLCIFIAILSVISYVCGYGAYYKNYRQIISGTLFIIYIGINIVIIFVLWMSGNPFSMQQFLIIFLLTLLLFGIVRNQSNIDYLMERRNHPFENLPKNIRFYNMKLLSFMLAAIVLCFLIKDWLIAGIYWLIGAIWEIIEFIIRIVNWMINLLPKSGTSMPALQDASGIENQPYLLNKISYVIAVIILFMLIVHNREKIIRSIISLFHRIMEKIRSILHSTHIHIGSGDHSEYYYDREEFISPKEIQKEISQKKRLKEWTKSRKRYNKMPDSAEKIRFGYKLAVEGLKLCGLKIQQSDTTMEILDKSKKIIMSENCQCVTEEYNAVRYGDRNFHEESIQNLSETLDEIARTVGKKPQNQTVKFQNKKAESI